MRIREALFAIVWIMTTVAAPARGQAGGDTSSATKRTPGPQPPAPHQNEGKPREVLAESNCRAYAQAVIDAVKAGDPGGFNALVDWDSLFRAMTTGLDIPDKDRQDMFVGARRVIDDKERGFASQYIKIVKQGGSLTLLRVRRSHGRQVVLFRLIHPTTQGGVNYLEFAPQRFPDGKVRATDFYAYSAGEFVSATMRRTLLPMVADRSRTILDRLLTGEKDYVRDFPRLGQAMKLLNQGKAAEAHAMFKTLRPETRKQKVVLIGRMRAAQVLHDDEEYAAVLKEFGELFPNDPCLELLSIDAFLMRKDYDGAMKAIDRLDRSVGGDPYLDLLRANLREAQGDRKGARRFARQAVERERTLLPAHWALVAYSLEDKDHDETLARLQEIDRTFPMVFNDLSKVPAYAGFAKSPQYARWLEYLKAKPAAPQPSPPR
jgi:hypothetical protein